MSSIAFDPSPSKGSPKGSESPKDTVFFYRLEDYIWSTSYLDISGEYVRTSSRIRVRLLKLPVIKYTPKGVILFVDCRRRFVADHWTKRYACATYEAALESFIKRKEKQASIYRSRMARAEIAITLAKKGELEQ